MDAGRADDMRRDLRDSRSCLTKPRRASRLFGNPCECKSAEIQRSELPVGILDEADYFTVSSGQHYDANSVRLGIRRANCVEVSHADNEGFFLCDDLNCSQQVVLILTGIVSKRFCK